MTGLSLAATVAATALGTYSAIQQGNAQARQADAQADIARRNQQLAEDQASAQRQTAYEDMIRKRQEVADLVSRQRANAGASGAQVDVGSWLDKNMDTREKGEADALALYQQGLDQAWNSEIQAWNYDHQASAYKKQADDAKSAGWLNAGSTILGGMNKVGSMFGAKSSPSQAGKTWDRALHGWSTTVPRH